MGELERVLDDAEVGDLALLEALSTSRERWARWEARHLGLGGRHPHFPGIAGVKVEDIADHPGGKPGDAVRVSAYATNMQASGSIPTHSPAHGIVSLHRTLRPDLPHPFEGMVGEKVAGMKGADPAEKGTTAYRRQAFLTVRTALGRKLAGIDDDDPEWAAALDWWDRHGKALLAADPEMRRWLAGFADDPALREMLGRPS